MDNHENDVNTMDCTMVVKVTLAHRNNQTIRLIRFSEVFLPDHQRQSQSEHAKLRRCEKNRADGLSRKDGWIGEALERNLWKLGHCATSLLNCIIFLILAGDLNLNERIVKLWKSTHPFRTKVDESNFFTPSEAFLSNSKENGRRGINGFCIRTGSRGSNPLALTLDR